MISNHSDEDTYQECRNFGPLTQFDWTLYRSPLMKILDWTAKTFARECNSTGFCNHFYKTRGENFTITYLSFSYSKFVIFLAIEIV